MKSMIKFFALLIAVFQINSVMAADNITGTWQGKLVTAPGAEMTVQFIISQEASGSYIVILNSPDEGGIKNVKANSVVYSSGIFKLEVAELSGSYEGTLKDGKIDGKWKQEGQSFPLILSPYVKPVLSKKDMDKLLGSWNGKLTIPGGSLTIVFRFERTEKDEFKGFLDSPDQGGFGVPVTDMGINDGNITLKISSLMAEYTGKLSDNEIVGTFNQAGMPMPLTVKKGEYKAQAYKLDLPKETMDQLSGKWSGKMEAWDKKSAPTDVMFRFENENNGDFTGYVDMPAMGSKNMPITEAEFKDGKLTLKIKAANNVNFKGQLSGDKITGDWRGTPLTLTKEKP